MGTWQEVLGETLQARSRELSDAVADARQAHADFLDAWEKRDLGWLADSGYLTRELVKNVEKEAGRD